MTEGIVKFYKEEKGWGAISSPALPVDQDAWVHFSEIQGTGYRMLTAGDRVEFDFVAGLQDSFHFVAFRGPPTRARHSAHPAPSRRASQDRSGGHPRHPTHPEARWSWRYRHQLTRSVLGARGLRAPDAVRP